jgi:hypothetical protein
MVKFEINELTGILRPIPQLKQSAPEVPGMNKKKDGRTICFQ